MDSVDVFIAGTGVAGLTAALYSGRLGLSVTAYGTEFGGLLGHITNLENYPGIFPGCSGKDFLESLKTQAEHFGAEVKQKKIIAIDKIGSYFKITTEEKQIQSKALIFATGALHRTLNIPGEKEFSGNGLSYCAVCDGPFFKNKTVTVIGGGDSALSEALYLSEIAQKVNLIHRRSELKAALVLQEKLNLKKNINLILNCEAKKINGTNTVDSITVKNSLTQEEKELKTDGIFVNIGLLPQTSLLEIVKKDSNGYIITNDRMETMIPGLFCAGDVRAKPLRQIVTAASDGATAAFCTKEYIRSVFTGN